MRKILIVGATSAIAQGAARVFAKDGDSFFLVGRDAEKLKIVAEDLKVRGAAAVGSFAGDYIQASNHAPILRQASQFLSEYDTVLIAHGSLSDQKKCEASYQETEKELQINLLSILSLLTLIANEFEKKKAGTIAVIGSVAGDRGRKKNYVYGTSKAALAAFMQGLRGRLAEANVSVITLKPGFVDTPMTAGFKKGILFASAEEVGRGVYQAMIKKNEVVYLPWFWRIIMGMVCSVPERIFKKTNI